MGCNCGDNEYEIIVDNNGSCEPTTPEYNITLENVGVDGFSPTINQVNITSSSFQLQITDVNGTETTGDIPLLSYLDNNFVTNTDLADTLTAYVTSTSLATTLTNYVTNTSLATTLADYVTNSDLTTTLTNYVTNSSLSSTLNNYVTNSSLSSTLSAYALNNQVVHLSGDETITGTKTFDSIDGIIAPWNVQTNYISNASLYSSLDLDVKSNGYDKSINIGNSRADNIRIGNNNSTILLKGSSAKLNNKDIATTDQIPTVGNGTITITQGGVSKGTFTTNQSGNTTIALDAGGGSSYTAGTGIDITNDTISIDTSVVAQLSDIPDTSDMATKTWVGNQGYLTSADLPTNYVTTDTAQTISGAKTFSNDIKLGYGKAIRNIDDEVILFWGSGVTQVGDSYSELIFKGGQSYLRPQYNSSYLALTSDIPTVNNPTITFTQGGVPKGTITLNQSSNQTIALDAGGGGGVTIDDTTPSATKVYSSQKTQDLIDAKEDKFIVGKGIVLEEVTVTIPNDLTSETSSDIVYADNYEGTYYPYMAFDGDESTKWGLASAPTEQNPRWIVRDLGNAYPIARVVIKTESSGETINGGYVQGSNDKTNWTNIGTIDSTGDTTKTITCDDTNTYRYIRLYCTSVYGAGWGKVNEMTIYTSAVKVLSVSPTILNLITDLQDRIAALEANINGGNA